MAFPTHRITYDRRRGAVHVTVSHYTYGAVLCGAMNAEAWPYGPVDGELVINLASVSMCDHGGTRDAPAPWGVHGPGVHPGKRDEEGRIACACICDRCVRCYDGFWRCICPECNQDCTGAGRLGQNDVVQREREQGYPINGGS